MSDQSDYGGDEQPNMLRWWMKGGLNDDQRESLGIPRSTDGADGAVYDANGMLQGPWLTQAGRMRTSQNMDNAFATPGLNPANYGDQSGRERQAFVGDMGGLIAAHNPGISRNRLVDLLSAYHWQW